ncbi:MAG: LPS export ABC transporter ATP-binding protein [Candidatus Sumerlaeia bacterium]|nr:LPS export ABC transporter ATP-binding protein [Candidatus Sumerlaeia bacterium]
MAKLETKALVKVYGKRRVVNEVNIEIHQKEIVGLLGPNGAGKTTTFKMVLGFVKPDAGKILLDGQDITNLPVYKRARLGLGYLPQEISIFRKMTVEENLLAILEMLPLTNSERRERLEALMEQIGISHLAKSKAYTLSGGERRRVEIARALVIQPKILMLDEPFSGIDPKAVQELQEMIHQLRDAGLGIFITDHSIREALQITDRSYLIYEGKIELSGTSQELINNERARELYFGERFTMDVTSLARR